MGVLHSFSIKNIFYDEMNLRIFHCRVTIWGRICCPKCCRILGSIAMERSIGMTCFKCYRKAVIMPVYAFVRQGFM